MNAPSALAIPFNNSYVHLPERFHARQIPTPMPSPSLIRLNHALAELLGVSGEALDTPVGIDVLTGTRVPDGADPIAMVYAGHQFGGWAPQLGDGRAILLGEVIGTDGVRRDIQLKGAGRTPFSRSGDGRAVLGPVLREYVLSETMHALGIPTTRALAATLTGESVMREQVFPGAMLTRVAESLVRVGTFQFFAARRDKEGLRALADYVIRRHYPTLVNEANPYVALLQAVLDRQATLIAKWMHVGFIHGVMNTDNVQIAGETIDYGPCAFMDTYDPATVYSYIDRGGRYAFANQPRVGHWNIACLAQALFELFDDDEEKAVEIAQEAIAPFPDRFATAWNGGLAAKLGLTHRADEADDELIRDLLDLMHKQKADYTLTFRALCDVDLAADDPATTEFGRCFEDPNAVLPWVSRWKKRALEEVGTDADRRDRMRRVNPAIIPRNHLVEAAIQAGLEGDFAPFHTLVDTLSRPFDDHPAHPSLADPPLPHQKVGQTF